MHGGGVMTCPGEAQWNVMDDEREYEAWCSSAIDLVT